RPRRRPGTTSPATAASTGPSCPNPTTTTDPQTSDAGTPARWIPAGEGARTSCPDGKRGDGPTCRTRYPPFHVPAQPPPRDRRRRPPRGVLGRLRLLVVGAARLLRAQHLRPVPARARLPVRLLLRALRRVPRPPLRRAAASREPLGAAPRARARAPEAGSAPRAARPQARAEGGATGAARRRRVGPGRPPAPAPRDPDAQARVQAGATRAAPRLAGAPAPLTSPADRPAPLALTAFPIRVGPRGASPRPRSRRARPRAGPRPRRRRALRRR